MNRIEALRLAAEASGGVLRLQDEANGWPARASVGASNLQVEIYIGVLGPSHRGRDQEELRFQNPSKGHPIAASEDRFPLLLGALVSGGDGVSLLVGMDAYRRVGRETRQSLFVPTTLLEAGLVEGWWSQKSTSGEELVAFHPRMLERYCDLRLKERGDPLLAKGGNSVVHDGDESQRDLLRLMAAVWGQVGGGGESPRDHLTVLRLVFEDSRFVGSEASGSLDDLVQEIARVCEPDLEPDDLDVFVENGAPTRFLYETILSYLAQFENGGADAAPREEDEEEGDDDDDELESEPVDSSVRNFSVRHLFDLVDKGQLDIEPPWQRKDVWSPKKKKELIKSLLLGIPLPSIILHRKADRWSIIDGKQRLTAIVQFLRNEFKLPNYGAKAGRLADASKAFYDKPKKRSLPDSLRTSLELEEVPALEFKNVEEARLRQIFRLYNVAGIKLNAAEIRNAVYQNNPIHRVVYVLAGEGDGEEDLGIGGLEVQRAFAERLRATYPQAKNRYNGVDFLARYLGYSRAAQRLGATVFSLPSTSGAINNFFDYASTSEDATAVAKEIIRAFDDAQYFFDRPEDERLAFFVRNEKGERKFHKLAATTYMVAARLLRASIDSGSATEEEALAAADAVNVELPDKQQRATIWGFQAQVVLAVLNGLELEPSDVGRDWPEFLEKMTFCMPPDEDERESD